MRLMALVVATGLLWPASTFAQDDGLHHESIPDYRHGVCFSFVRQRRDAGSNFNLLSKVQSEMR
jgi:hypothetical protein